MAFLDLATQRRIWIALIPALVLAANAFGVPMTQDLLVTTGDKVVTGVMAILSLWSFFMPRQGPVVK